METFKPICGADLERWRLANGLTKATAADALGLQLSRWQELTAPAAAAVPVDDPAVALLLELYQRHRRASPVPPVVDVRQFYDYLGFSDTARDRAAFAALIGRSPPSAHRLTKGGGAPGSVLKRLVEGVLRLNLPPKKARELMTALAQRVGERQGCADVLQDGWVK